MPKLILYLNKCLSIFCIIASLFHLYTAGFGVLEPVMQRSIHLMFMFPLAFIIYPASTKVSVDSNGKIQKTISTLFAIASFLACLYVFLHVDVIRERIPFVTPVSTTETFVGVIFLVVLLEAVRRAVAPAMMWLIVLSVFYVFTAPYLPGFLYNSKVSLPRFMEMLYIFQDTGIFGTITGVSATFAAIFVIFASFIGESGLGAFFTNFSLKIMGTRVGGPAKVSVISSGLFGSISGVAAANVYATGSFTIPMMNNLGYRPQFAAAVETAASTGGLIMPPIMGVGAFVMSQITGVPYWGIVKAAFIGALLYYFGVFYMVHLNSLKQSLRPLQANEVPSWSQVLKNIHLLFPMVILVWLISRGFTPPFAAFYSLVSGLVILFATNIIKGKGYKETFDVIIITLEQAAKNTVMIAMACAGAGVIVSVLACTGLSMSLTSLVIAFSRGFLFLGLFFAMVISIILGMGLPCVAAYIVAISVIGPSLMQMGLGILQAHLFVYYFAILAALTPPVCIAAYAAASIASSNPMKTGFESLKLAVGGFLIPYVFVFNRALLFKGKIYEIFFVLLIMICSMALISSGLIGYFRKKLGLLARMAFLISGLALAIIVAMMP